MIQVNGWMRRGLGTTAVLALGALLLVGCDKNTITTIHENVYSSPQVQEATRDEKRAEYLADLRNEGVQVIELGETVRLVMLSAEVFEPNSANIVSAYRPVLVDAARFMATYDITSVKVGSYGSKRLPKGYQLALTTRQAQAVSTFLWSQGVDARLMYAKGYEASKPVDSNASYKGRNNNSRVEVSFQYHTRAMAY